METYYFYIAIALIGSFILIRFLFFRNEKDRKDLEDKFNNEYKKTEETEVNDRDPIN
ncbi:MAG: hypothetical protein V4670_12325 [Bacteroidota bacterium]